LAKIRRDDAAPVGFLSWTFDGFLQHPNAGTGARVALGTLKKGGSKWQVHKMLFRQVMLPANI